MTVRAASRAARMARAVAIGVGLWAATATEGFAVRRENGGGRGGGFAGARADGSKNAAAKVDKRHGRKKAPSSPPPDLTPMAKALLDKHQNNVDAASTEYYSSQLQKLTSAYDAGEAGSTSTRTETSTLTPERRHKLRLQAAWDAVALFLPVDYQRTGGKVDPFVHRRLSMIAASCRIVDGSRNGEGVGAFRGQSLLDVGCGDGGIVPYLDRSCITAYLGIDVSPEMIDLGRRRHPGDNFVVGCFPDDVLAAPGDPWQHKVLTTAPQSGNLSDGFDCVLFNGSLQFFADPKVALLRARDVLRHESGAGSGRIVIAHAMGSKFVATECRSNPSVALSHLPPVESTLREIAEELGMRVMTKQELLQGLGDLRLQESDTSDSNFYLAALSY